MSTAPTRQRRPRKLSTDEAFIALIIGAMEANGHAAPEEAARAQHILSSMSRFRRRKQSDVGRLIAAMKQMTHDRDPLDMVAAACRAIPSRLRGSAFAVVADVILIDGRLERDERRFLRAVGTQLGQPPAVTRILLEDIRLKNQA
jgi:tellurite resistance protein